jgi:uncharacterized protein (DUF885 family)
MVTRPLLPVIAPILALLSGCSGHKPAPNLSSLVEEFVYTTLSFSPVNATQAGYHEHQGMKLDQMLDDYSPASLDRQRRFYQDFKQRLGEIKPDRLTPEERADYDMIDDQIGMSLLDLDEIQTFRHNPTLYVETIGNALFSPFVLDYAPKAERQRQIVARLTLIPSFLDQARRNLVDSPEIWNTVAAEENDGNIELIAKEIPAGIAGDIKADYDTAAGAAIAALRSFNDYLRTDLAKRPSDWRLGKEKYARKFRYTLATGETPEKVLGEAEAQLTATRKEMFDVALPLHHQWYPSHKDPVDVNLIVSETLDKIARRHATPATYFSDAKRDLEETRQFVKSHDLLTLPARDNLQVIPTPEFMRGIYGVGGFNPAPPLEPQLGAFYWITPIPAAWKPDRIESKLREYNTYGLKLLTIHEAMPGHYVQGEYANAIQPKARRVLREIYGNGPYVEGWAVYATELMIDQGYLNNSPELRLTFLKQVLRLLANAILDIRLQTMGMTDQQALDLMIKRTFQETEEATAKLQRAKLSSTQLPTYFVGWRGWRGVRDGYKQAKGASFQLNEFHERALKEGAVSLPTLGRLLAIK